MSSEDDEFRRKEWVNYYVEIGDYASARSLGWDGEPARGQASNGESAKSSNASTRKPLTGTDAAAVKIQASYRGHVRRDKYKDERNEAARLQYIEYYVATKQYDAARAYGWDGTEPSTETERAATVVQKTYRGFRQREDYKDVRDEEARQQWVAYYLRTGQVDKAKEFGYEPPTSRVLVPRVPLASHAASSRAYTASAALAAITPSNLSCLGQVAEAFTPRAAKAKRLKDMEAVLTLQRYGRGLIARTRARLLQREELLYELVNRQEARHAKRIEFYVNLFLSSREKNSLYHAKASTIQAGFRGRQARIVRRNKLSDREELRLKRQREEAEAAAAEMRRLREAEAESAARRPGAGVSFAQANSRAASEELVLPRPIEVNPRMSVHDINSELERSAHVAARQMAEKQRGRELATRTMQNARGVLKKTSPNSLLPAMSSHKRFFFFEGERFCWRASADSGDDDPSKKYLPLTSITSVLIAAPLERHEFTLHVTGLAKPYVMRAASQKELLMWVQAFKIVLAVQEEMGSRARGGVGR